MQESVAFVLCIENNAIREQALLLIESIRTFAGKHKDAEIIAISTRGLGVEAVTQRRLAQLNVRYVDLPLNRGCPDYGPTNRIYGAAWAAQNSTASTLIVVDSDTIFLGEPELLGGDFDFAGRPVDLKNTTSTGPGDPLETYLASLCAEVGCSLDTIPFIELVVDRHRVRATYNAGYSVVRRENAVLELAADIFTRSAERDLRLRRGASTQVFASTGWVGTVANEYWGSSQAVMSVAIWSTGQRVKQLDARYNVPLHLLADQEALSEEWSGINPVHVHYHWLFTPKHWSRTVELLASLGTQGDRLDWLLSRMPLSGAECPT